MASLNREHSHRLLEVKVSAMFQNPCAIPECLFKAELAISRPTGFCYTAFVCACVCMLGSVVWEISHSRVVHTRVVSVCMYMFMQVTEGDGRYGPESTTRLPVSAGRRPLSLSLSVCVCMWVVEIICRKRKVAMF